MEEGKNKKHPGRRKAAEVPLLSPLALNLFSLWYFILKRGKCNGEDGGVGGGGGGRRAGCVAVVPLPGRPVKNCLTFDRGQIGLVLI